MKKNLPVTNKEIQLKDDETIISTTDLKGVITYVNKEFLNISGFSEEEVVGHSHNVVRHPDMPPAAFEDLWSTVKKGNSWRGMVKNRCKNGDHYWVEAFVSPIIEDGQKIGYQSVRSKATTEQIRAADTLYAKLNKDSSLKIDKPFRILDMSFFKRMATIFLIAGALPLFGDILWSFGLVSSSVMVGLAILSPIILLIGLIYFYKYMHTPITQLIDQVELMSSGNLKQKISIESEDEIGKLKLALKLLQARFSTVVGKLSEDSYNMMLISEKLNHTSSESYQLMAQQMSDTTGVSTATTQMTSSIQEVAQSSETTSVATQNAAEQTNKGTNLVKQLGETVSRLVHEVTNTSNVIDELHNKSQDVTNIISTISSIAEQTNLLALNAAIEAARAGEQGRGFAVVADEVRNLAVKTQDATGEIHRVLEDMHSNINQAVEVMEHGKEQASIATDQSAETLVSLSQISEEIGNVNTMISQIATSATEQAAASSEISIRINNISEQTNSTMSVAQLNSEVSNQLGEHTEKIMKDVAYFDSNLNVEDIIRLASDAAKIDVEIAKNKAQNQTGGDIDLF